MGVWVLRSAKRAYLTVQEGGESISVTQNYGVLLKYGEFI